MSQTAKSSHSGNLDFSFETITQEVQRLFFVVGQSNGGKSLFTGVASAAAKLYDDERFLLVDAEEGANHAFAKTDKKKVQKIRLMDGKNYDQLVIALDTLKKDRALVDLPGTSLEAVGRAINFGRLAETNVGIIPIIVVGLRANSTQVAQDWVELYADRGIKKIYWIWNNQDPSQSDERTLPELPENAPEIIEIRIPALNSEIAKVIVSEGICVLSILQGKHKDNPVLSNRNALGELGGWLKQFIDASRPLLIDLKN